MAIKVPEIMSPNGILICVCCDDEKASLFQEAKRSIQDLEKEEFIRNEPFLTQQFKNNGWFQYTEVTIFKVVSGKHQGIRGAGVGSNKAKYERAAALALAVAVEVQHGGRPMRWAQSLVDRAKALSKSLCKDGGSSPSKPSLVEPLPLQALPPTKPSPNQQQQLQAALARAAMRAPRGGGGDVAAGASSAPCASSASAGGGDGGGDGGHSTASSASTVPMVTQAATQQAAAATEVAEPAEEERKAFPVAAIAVYKAECEGYLSLRPGDHLMVQYDEDGFYFGYRLKCENARGWFPQHAVQLPKML